MQALWQPPAGLPFNYDRTATRLDLHRLISATICINSAYIEGLRFDADKDSIAMCCLRTALGNVIQKS